VEALNPDCGHPTQRRVVAPAISRRALIATIAGSLLAAVKAPAGSAAPARFGFREVARKAEALAGRGYTPGPPLPAPVGTWSYEDYRRIQFKLERTLWRGEGMPFEVDFFPRGARFDTLVRMNVLTGGDGRVLDFDPSMYVGWPSAVSAEDQSQLGFAGLRARYPLSGPVPHEFAAFLGSSYFRAAGRGQLYGASARCVAIDTGTDRREEFPALREFWLVRPEPGSDVLVLYGLLDSPSLTGAFEFDLRPGSPTRIHVTGALFARREVRKLALAPVSSMFLFGETRARAFDDFRPEVHDSDGLLVASGTGEWFWRPLDNPARLRISRFPGTGLHGFGLLQRDRLFDHYHDLEALYHRRTSVWIVPRSDWGRGTLELLEFPSAVEYHDNVALLWVAERPLKAGRTLEWTYEIQFGGEEVDASPAGRVVSTRIGEGRSRAFRRFVIEFEGPGLGGIAEDAIQPLVTGRGDFVSPPLVQRTPAGGCRVVFEVKGSSGPYDLQCALRVDGARVTETWTYQWNP
jgi:periplasmic glucans biosynthesis protein